MSGFSAEWLALREPADRRARNPEIAAALRARFAGQERVSVIDLGCGAGSNLRATAAHLGPHQRWQLVDNDAALLAAARERLVQWADCAEPAGDTLRLSKGGCHLEVSFAKVDLAADLELALADPVDLVTAAALFDLVSIAWIEHFARIVVGRHIAFYTALTYNGVEAWEPPHAADGAVLAAFHAHQARDKGFGPSAGPAAIDALARDFLALGYEVMPGDSPWRLGADQAELIRELAHGIAVAVRETGELTEEEVGGWLA
ncbi:MAG TPA: SAM-dependent methyltransferase, partial [Beijerinckiaceae bacterium]|nr:SAM-dependent methyltransferase [Beijerinckiaceae bacterium]